MTRVDAELTRPEKVKFYNITQMAYAFGAGGHLILGMVFWWLAVVEMVWFNFLLSVPLFLTALQLNRAGHHDLAFSLAFFELLCHQIAGVYFVGWAGGFQFFLVYLAALTFFNTRWSGRLRALLILVVVASFTLLYLFCRTSAVYRLAPVYYDLFYLANSLSTLLALALLVNYYVRATNTAENNFNAANRELSEKNTLIQQALTERNQAFERLHHEIAEAADYVRAILPAPIEAGSIRTAWRLIPSTSLGGDAFGYHWIDDDHFALYLIDVSGHGVGAALLSVSVINTLRTHSLTDTDFSNPGEVLNALNLAFPSEENNDMFFTIWYGVYHRTTREIVYAAGGHPPALLKNGNSGQTGSAIELKTPNNVIGGLPGVRYQTAQQRIAPGDTLYIFSDGVYEIRKADGAMWRFSEFSEYVLNLAAAGSAKLDALYRHVRDLGNADQLEDDFTILAVHFR